jgi:hypothetical protein
MYTCGKRPKKPLGLLIGRERSVFLIAPGQMLLIEPDQHRSVARQAAESIGKADLVVALGPDREIDTYHACHVGLHRARRQNRMRRRQRPAFPLLLDLYRANPAAGRVESDDPSLHDLHTARADRLQHHHAKLLGAEPSGAAGMGESDRFRGEKWEVLADQACIGDDVRSRQPIVETAFGRGRIGALRRIVESRGPSPTRLGRFCHRFKESDLARIGGREHVAPTVEINAIVGRAGDLLDKIDAAVHEGRHGPIRARPPVAIGFGRFVRRERERIALIDQRYVIKTELDGKVVGRCDSGDAGATNDDLR